jgi:hypothetical protein
VVGVGPVRTTFALLVAFCGLLAAASAVAERSAPTVTIGSAKFSGSWHEGWFGVWQRRVVHHLGRSDYDWKRVGDGSVNVVGTVSEAAQLEVALRNQVGKVVTASKPFSVPAGRYRTTLKVGRPLPGTYTASTAVLGPSHTTVTKVEKSVNFGTPLEGVPDRASIGATKKGPSVKRLHAPRHEAWARFHFLTLPPKARWVYIEWRQPNWIHVCQTPTGPARNCRLRKPISADGWVYTFLRSTGPALDTGRWYAQMSVGHTVARRTFVTIR